MFPSTHGPLIEPMQVIKQIRSCQQVRPSKLPTPHTLDHPASLDRNLLQIRRMNRELTRIPGEGLHYSRHANDKPLDLSSQTITPYLSSRPGSLAPCTQVSKRDCTNSSSGCSSSTPNFDRALFAYAFSCCGDCHGVKMMFQERLFLPYVLPAEWMQSLPSPVMLCCMLRGS